MTLSVVAEKARGAASKALKAVKRRSGGARGVVLMYHRIAKPPVDPWDLSVSPERFDEQIAAIAVACEPVALADFPGRLGGRSDAARIPVAVTFDDGYRDNLTRALPILRRHDCPATVFIASAFVGSETPYWWDVLAEIVMLGTIKDGELLSTSAGDVAITADGGTDAGRRALLTALWDNLLSLAPAERDEQIVKLQGLFERTPSPEVDALPMTAEEIRRLGETIDIGAHTINHLALPRFADDVKRREIGGSKAAVEAILGRPVVRFAYPYGAVDRACRIAAEAEGIALAVSCVPDSHGPDHDIRAIPRIQVVEDWSGAELVRRIKDLVAI